MLSANESTYLLDDLLVIRASSQVFESLGAICHSLGPSNV